MIKKVLILDDVGGQAITDILSSVSVDYFRKMLKTSERNWQSIVDLIHSENIDAVIGVLSETALYYCSEPEYDGVFEDLAEHILPLEHIILVFEDNLDGEFTYYEAGTETEYGEEITDDHINKMRQRINFLNELGINLAPYRKRVDKTLSVQAFVEGLLRGLLLRLYVPNERIYSQQIDRFIALFTSYTQKVLGSDITVEQHRTGQGIIYTFLSSLGKTTMTDLSEINEEFASFLDICATDISKAEKILASQGISSKDVPDLLRRYSIESRRLRIDMQHEKESRLLAIRHRFESELMDVATKEELDSVVHSLQQPQVPTTLNAFATTPISANVVNIINPKFIGHVNGIVVSELYGNIEYTENDKKLIELFDKFAEKFEAVTLKASLDILKDKTAEQKDKTIGWQTIRQFIARRADKIEDTAYKVLQEYLLFLFKGGRI